LIDRFLESAYHNFVNTSWLRREGEQQYSYFQTGFHAVWRYHMGCVAYVAGVDAEISIIIPKDWLVADITQARVRLQV